MRRGLCELGEVMSAMVQSSIIGELPTPQTGKTGWPWTNDSSTLPATLPDGSTWPRISVVTPSYDQGLFIEETIRSVLLQGYPNLEYIVMDGGSTDGTSEILYKYEPFFSYLHVGPDGGQAAAIADGFKRATGDIFAWLNSDDIYQPGTLARVGRYFSEHPQHVLVSGDVQLIDASSKPCGRLWACPTQLFLTKNTGGHGWWQPGTFWRKRTYIACGAMDRQLRFCMDRDLFVRICSAGQSGCIRGTPLASFRTHDTQKSQTIKSVFLEEHELLLKRYGNPRTRRWQRFLGRLWWAWMLADRFKRKLFERWMFQ